MDRKYDVIVAGAGLGGLTCGALLAKQGKKTLVIEQHFLPGGYCTSFKRKGFVFESAGEWIEGYDRGIVSEILHDLNISSAIQFDKIDPLFVNVFPNEIISIPEDMMKHGARLQTLFPQEAPNIKKFFQYYERVNTEMQTLPTGGELWSLLHILLRHRHCIACLKKTYAEMLNKYFTDNRLKSVLSGMCGLIGLLPSQFSAIVLAPFLIGGTVPRGRVHGGMQNFANALAQALQKNGGDLLLRRKVQKIIVRDGHVVGVVLDKDEQIEASTVVSNVDAYQTFTKLVDAKKTRTHLARRIAQAEYSHSAFKVWLGVDMQIQTPQNASALTYFPSYQIEDFMGNTIENVLSNEGYLFISIPSLDDDSLAPSGMHSVDLLLSGNYYDIVKDMNKDQYKVFKDQLADALVVRAEKIIPGLSKHIVVKEVATPLTFERYTHNYHGASIGWGMSPKALSQALDQKTEIKGLYLAGHWTYPGGGIGQVMMSGKLAAKMILGSK